jgi:hypothetical protein
MIIVALVVAFGLWLALIIVGWCSCKHERTTFPQRPPGAKESHITCLDCGRELPYSVLDPKRDL